MTRAILVILDSVGIGGAPDAARFGDEGANTIGHIAGKVDLKLPHLASLGLAEAAEMASGARPKGFAQVPIRGRWGYGIERSNGKDTPSGHWEIAGAPVTFDWGYFPRMIPAISNEITGPLIARCNLTGVLGNKHASGTEIIVELGEEHIQTGKPIIYTSADSVLQIAAHEQAFGLDRLLDVCRVARELTLPLKIGRVIARPFTGSDRNTFARTANRRDFSIAPPEPTLLDRLTAAGRDVVSLGKVGDIFAHQGTGREIKAAGNDALFDTLLTSFDTLADGGLIVVNFVDFDMHHGHRRDVAGYASALEAFDRRLPQLLGKLRDGDLLIITADHGCDPTWRGTDHTRECVPVLAYSLGITPGSIGRRDSFADIGQSIAKHLGIPPLAHGIAWH